MAKWRLHTQFEVDRSIPIRIDVTRRAGLCTGRKPTLRSALQVVGVDVIDRLKPVLLSALGPEAGFEPAWICVKPPAEEAVGGTGRNGEYCDSRAIRNPPRSSWSNIRGSEHVTAGEQYGTSAQARA